MWFEGTLTARNNKQSFVVNRGFSTAHTEIQVNKSKIYVHLTRTSSCRNHIIPALRLAFQEMVPKLSPGTVIITRGKNLTFNAKKYGNDINVQKHMEPFANWSPLTSPYLIRYILGSQGSEARVANFHGYMIQAAKLNERIVPPFRQAWALKETELGNSYGILGIDDIKYMWGQAPRFLRQNETLTKIYRSTFPLGEKVIS